MIVGRILIFAILIWTFVYTVSFGIWTWKKENKLGAVMVFVLALTTIVLPIYSIYFRK